MSFPQAKDKNKTLNKENKNIQTTPYLKNITKEVVSPKVQKNMLKAYLDNLKIWKLW